MQKRRARNDRLGFDGRARPADSKLVAPRRWDFELNDEFKREIVSGIIPLGTPNPDTSGRY